MILNIYTAILFSLLFVQVVFVDKTKALSVDLTDTTAAVRNVFVLADEKLAAFSFV